MKEPPAKTFAHMLQDLYARPEHRSSRASNGSALPNATMRRDLHARRRHFFNKRVSLINYLSPQTRPEEMLVDDSATRDRPRAGPEPDRDGGPRPLLRRLLADDRASTTATRAGSIGASPSA